MHIYSVWLIFHKILQLLTLKKTALYGYIHDFLVDFGNIDVDDITNIPKYLIKKLCNINIWIH